ncbi:MAG: RecX family transcriptional regulator [Bacteroidales bacterium]|jgi:regulatory protein|nr:RecX family transcriptional regulator [Bacteroidales bacterium]
MAESALYNTALARAMALCSGSEHCMEEIRSKLAAWKVGEADSERIINVLVRENFINEKRYAEAYVKDKFRHNKWGRIKIRAGLRLKKIPAELISTALGSIDNETYVNSLREMISAHRKSVRAKNQFDLKGKLYRFGLSRGFESDLLYSILSAESADPDQEGHEGYQENH